MESGLLSLGGFPITCLNGKNYATWVQKVHLLLRKEALWYVVSNPPRHEDWDEEDDADKLSQFHRNNERVLCFIGLTLEDHQLVHIRGLESAKECWDILKTIYVHESAGAQIHLTRKLFRARLNTGGNMLTHLEYMKHTLYELQEQELTFTELQSAYIMLSLDESYDNFIVNMEVWPRTEITMAGITSRLLNEARQRKDSALLCNSCQTPSIRREKEQLAEDCSGQTAKAYTIKKCFKCGAARHFANHCKASKGKKVGATGTHPGALLALNKRGWTEL